MNPEPWLDHVLSKALEKERELRYQTASDLRADLKRLGRELDSSPSTGMSVRKSSGVRRAAALTRTSAMPLLVIIGLLLLVVASFVGWRYINSRRDAPDWSRATHIQLTDEAGTEFHPSLAPDSKSFVYSSDQSGNFDLYLQRVGGKNPSNLTKESAADDSQPAFSPDGERIAFRSEREPPGVYVMGATGENLRLVAGGGFHPSWSPDGREIAYSLRGRDAPDVRNTTPSQIWVVNVESGAKRLLCEMDAMQPSWSPHGARVAFWFMPTSVGRSDVATVPSAGGEPVVVTKDATTNWSPDGTRLLYRKEGTHNLIIDLGKTWDAQTPEQLPPPNPGKSFVVWDWSPDGRKLCGTLTSASGTVVSLYSFDTGRYEQVGDLNGQPNWLPDSRRLVFSHEGKAYIADTSTKKVRELLAHPPEQIRSVAVSRDGRLLYYTLHSTESDVWLLNLE